MDRRILLKTLGALGSGAFVTSCASHPAGRIRSAPAASALPVLVSRDRIIRTVVGLRPYRPGGFVLQTTVVDGKPIIHNYGHGGAGITLSWGCAQLAAEEALLAPYRECAVIGCGVIGLTTAVVLQRRGFRVTIYARDLPPRTTSNVAAGLWLPESVGDRFPELEQLETGQHRFPRAYVSRYMCLQIQSPVFLAAIERDFRLHGGAIVVQESHSLRDVLGLPQPLILNCTGLGARELVGDTGLFPVKGQLTVLLPQPEINYDIGIDDDLYMHPRPDGIFLGGTFERGAWSLEANDSESERIFKEHQGFFGEMRKLRRAQLHR
jgi:D-amino-acid oxidase